MIKVENIEIFGIQAAIRGMRNPKNSWDKSDSSKEGIGDNDMKLMKVLFDAGPEHRKYDRMINVYMDITAPRFWWTEFDTYKIGTVANSCSTMHTIMKSPFCMSDFSLDYTNQIEESFKTFEEVVGYLNSLRDLYLDTSDSVEKKFLWRCLIEVLPQSYNQKRTVCMNYEVANRMIDQRSGHKLDEWREFVDILKDLPYMRELRGEEV